MPNVRVTPDIGRPVEVPQGWLDRWPDQYKPADPDPAPAAPEKKPAPKSATTRRKNDG